MSALKKTFGKKAAKATVLHSGRGLKSKATRQPMRSATLLGTGGAVGALAGFLLGRRTG